MSFCSVYDPQQPTKKFSDLCVTVPAEYSELHHYRATLGHKANHADAGKVMTIIAKYLNNQNCSEQCRLHTVHCTSSSGDCDG